MAVVGGVEGEEGGEAGLTLLARVKQALRAVCVHEVVAAYNLSNGTAKSKGVDTTDAAAAGGGDTVGDASGGLCAKIQADKAVGAASALSAKAVAAAVEEAQSHPAPATPALASPVQDP